MPDIETRYTVVGAQKPAFSDAKEAGSWYSDSSELVIPRPADAGCSTHQPPPRSVGPSGGNEKKGRRTKILLFSVLACLGVAAMALAAVQIARLFHVQLVTSDGSGAKVYSYGYDDLPSAEDFEDYRDFFNSYYVDASDVDIEPAETGTGVTLPVEPLSRDVLPMQDIYERVSPTVVGVTTYLDGMEYGWGTGVIFTADGYIITNTHVLMGGDAAVVTLSDGTELEARLVGADERSDIAVLRVEAKLLPCAEFGDSDGLRVGDDAYAIGNPLGPAYAGTMTNGIISAINRNIVYNGHSMTLLQTNAALNEGNSGGPLVNAAGQVVGITNMKIMSTYSANVEGIGFAIPTSVVKAVADQLIENGIVMGEPTIGIVAGSIPAEARESYDLPNGVYVSSVDRNSDAWTQGLREGDVILEVNGIAVASVAEVNVIKGDLEVGDTLDLTVYRRGETLEMTIELVDKSVIE